MPNNKILNYNNRLYTSFASLATLTDIETINNRLNTINGFNTLKVVQTINYQDTNNHTLYTLPQHSWGILTLVSTAGSYTLHVGFGTPNMETICELYCNNEVEARLNNASNSTYYPNNNNYTLSYSFSSNPSRSIIVYLYFIYIT